jgi:hypothetical protein
MSDSKASGGLGLSGALFIVFVVLRLTDHIDWAWYWVASPLWIPLAAVLTISATVLPLYACGAGLAGLAGVMRRHRQMKAWRRQMKAWREKHGVPKL